MALTNEIIKQKLSEKFGGELTGLEEPYGMLTFSTNKELNLKVLQFLYDDPEAFQLFVLLLIVRYNQ